MKEVVFSQEAAKDIKAIASSIPNLRKTQFNDLFYDLNTILIFNNKQKENSIQSLFFYEHRVYFFQKKDKIKVIRILKATNLHHFTKIDMPFIKRYLTSETIKMNKVLFKNVRSKIKGTDWKLKGNYLYRYNAGYFYSVELMMLPIVSYCSIKGTVKPIAIDDIYWLENGLQENLNMPLSFRHSAAFQSKVRHSWEKEEFIMGVNMDILADSFIEQSNQYYNRIKQQLIDQKYSDFLMSLEDTRVPLNALYYSLLNEENYDQILKLKKISMKFPSDSYIRPLEKYKTANDLAALLDLVKSSVKHRKY